MEGGIVLGSAAHYFAPRLLNPAVPFLVLLVAWALDRLGRLRKGILIVSLAVLLAAFWPTSSRFVYEKSLEVSGSFDPHEYHAILSRRTLPDDFVFFNHLALAGWYEIIRDRSQPTHRWSAGEVVKDHHGLLLAARSATPLHLAVSLYNADTGEPVLVDGNTFLELGTLRSDGPR